MLLLVIAAFLAFLPSTTPASGDEVFLNDRSADIIGSSPLLAPGLLTPSGLSGKGQIVGIADSGLDRGSLNEIISDLQSEQGKMPRVAILRSYSGRTIPDDPIGHGTHMAAIIAGNGKASNGKYQGIAPGSSLYFQALLDQSGTLKVPLKIEDLYHPAYDAGVRIHVNGWGGGSNSYSSRSAQLDNFVYRFPDFLPVFGAGNNGPSKGSLTAEANSKNVLTIGSSQVPRPAFGTDARYADRIAELSSRGPAADGRIKPELLAPGSAVISVCSSLVESNFAANNAYTILGGSSMAAAVAGGAIALLSEYLEIAKQIPNPSSALIKALLVNGARPLAGGQSAVQGYGILDLASTILALEEDSFKMIDEKNGIQSGQMLEYKVQVAEAGTDFRATLAWVDPPAEVAANQALVNNLNLIIQDPQGKNYYGNDFNHQGSIDNINNIEQIIIPDAVRGEYTIRIQAGELKRVINQNFALVYGQPLKYEVFTMQAGDTKDDAGESDSELGSRQVFNLLDGKLLSGTQAIPVGSDLYTGAHADYIFSRSWLASGVQALREPEGDLLLEISTGVREGGYFMDRTSPAVNIVVNSQQVDEIQEIPPGSEVKAAINPVMQTIWQLEAMHEEVTGFIEKVDFEKGELKLLQNDQVYLITSGIAIAYCDKLRACDLADIPYGTEQTAHLENLAPGLKVVLTISPSSRQVQYIEVERELILGQIREANDQQGQITLESGGSYRIFPGTMVIKDQHESSLKEIKQGDHIAAILLTGSQDIIQLYASSEVFYGRVLFYSSREKSLYILDKQNILKKVGIDYKSGIYRRGLQIEALSITPGAWVRVVHLPGSSAAWRVDIADTALESTRYFKSYDPERKTISFTDGTCLGYSDFTQALKGGYLISPDMITFGEKVKIYTLATPGTGPEFLARLEVAINPAIAAPELQVRAYSLNGVLIIQGQSNAEQVFVCRANGSWVEIGVGKGGAFSGLFTLLENEQEIKILALNKQSGGIKGTSLAITAFPVENKEEFVDISGHLAENKIKELRSRGIISGYADNCFKPEQSVNRAEFICMLARAQGWSSEYSGSINYFADNRDIPWWALGAVYAAREQGIIRGYPDDSFRPYQLLKYSDMIKIMEALLQPQAEAELMQFLAGSRFQTSLPLTRAQAVMIIEQLIK
ncbi:MAG: S8 family serine peptidase [Syntrophomonadaceae bacterium]|nr:S8 family serine peptidase [Syntrophomonadaceae bacterium]